MENKNMKTGGDENFIKKEQLILSNWNGDFKEQETNDIDTRLLHFECDTLNAEELYSKIPLRARTEMVKTKRLIIAAACFITLTASLAVYANVSGLLTKIFYSNKIKYNTATTTIDVESRKYDSLESAAEDLKLQLPVLTLFPEELSVADISTEKSDNLIRINARYVNNENDEKIMISYKYYKNPENFSSEIDINDTYMEVEPLGIRANILSDIERKITVVEYDTFNIHVVTVYSQPQVEEMIKNIKIIKIPIG